MTQLRQWTPADKDWLRQHYPDTPTDDCAAYLGRSVYATSNRANIMRLKKSPQFMAALWFSPEHRTRISLARKAVVISDRRRWKNDLPQRTRLHFRTQSQSKYAWRFRMRRAGYVEFADDKNRMYYPDELKRHPRLEAHAKRHHVVVLPMSERFINR